MSLIELKDICFSYDDTTQVFDHFNLSVNQGDLLIIKGDNGSGKSTLFQLLNGLLFSDNGDYYYNQQLIDVKYLKDQIHLKSFHKSIAYLFQNVDVMLFNGTVYDEIAFGIRQIGLSDEEVDHRVKDLVKLFDIESLLDKAPYHLSGGQKKKVALASILILNPDVIILDEPFAGLDSNTQNWLLNLIKDLNESHKTIILSTHLDHLLDDLNTKIIELF